MTGAEANNTKFAVVSATVSNTSDADRLARRLVEARLAACVQFTPITSVYRWNGVVESAAEVLLLCKIRASDFDAVEAEIRSLHTYDVPEILLSPIDRGHEPYLKWIEASTDRVAP